MKSNLRIRARSIEHDFGGAKIVSAVNDRDALRKLRQEGGFFHRRVAAADDENLAIAEKISVAGSAGGNAKTQQRLFRCDAEHPRGGPRGNDQRLALEALFAGDNLEWRPAQIHRRDRSGAKLRAKPLRLLSGVLDELRPQDSVRKAGEILDHRRKRQLAAGLVAVKDERLQVGARRVNGSGQSRASAADDDDFFQLCLLNDSIACYWMTPRERSFCPEKHAIVTLHFADASLGRVRAGWQFAPPALPDG